MTARQPHSIEGNSLSDTDRNGIANISACIEVPDGCQMESRIGAHGTVEFTFGTWQGGAEVHFERYAPRRSRR